LAKRFLGFGTIPAKPFSTPHKKLTIMKRLFTLIVALLSLTTVSAQNQLAERNPWWWGADFGGSFQTSDMQPRAGFTFGISAAKYTRVSARSPIYFGLRFRFTDGRNFGYNYNRLDVSNNPVLNSGTTNYANDPANAAGVFSNYRFRYDEFGADLIFGSNTLRKRGVLLYGFGGAALNYWQTKTNLLNASGNLYDYSAITDAGDKDLVGDQLDNLLDDTYETNADGSVNGGQWSFMPSAGFGFGYEWRAFAIGMEHRTTFALNDVIDGTRYNQVGQLTPNNDMYHYTGLFLRWRFGTTSSSTTTNNNPPLPPTPVVTNTPPVYTQTPPVITDPDPVQTSPNGNPNLSVLPPPQVDFTVPSTNPYTATTVNQQLTVRVLNVLQQSQISLTINGQTMPQSAFNFNPTSHLMTFNHTLQPGNNTYYVVATNSAGSDNDNQTIIFKSGSSNNGVPPQVTFTNPATSPVTWTQPSQLITATTQNVAAASNVQITQNGLNVTNFTFNAATGVVTFPANLQNGSNLYQITVTNNFGMANDATTILYNNVPAPAKPVLTITNPASCPHSTKVQNMTITATVTNVTAANQVSVVFNGAAVTNFSFALNGTVATISFPVVLNSGVNNLTITGTNAAGSDIKTCQITYKPQSPTVQPPVVTITSPAACPHISKAQNLTITATVTNVTAASQINVLFNGTAVTNFSFALNGTVATISFPVVLNSGANTLSITGTNAAGTDAESCQITYKGQSPVLLPPDVTITNPSSCPLNTKNQNMTITATVANVTAANQVNVVFNGTTINNFGFTLNGTTATVSFPVTLNVGNNAVSITGTNSVGSDVAECQIIYTVLVPTVNPPKVTITNPAICPHNTKSKSMTITATVTNVTAANQVNVVFNGTAVSNFTFTLNRNVATVSFPVSLNAGNNTVVITGTNTAGTDSKDCQIIYTVLVPTVNPPVVTYTVPASNPYTSTTPNVSVTANVTNVTAANQVTVSVNNAAVTNFGFTVNGNNATVTFPVAINMGQNISCVVTGTNTAGTDSEQMTIMYHPLAPAVNITNPASSPYTSTTAAYTFTATVLNVGSAAEITVLVNNAQVSGFNYNMSSKVLTYSTTLNPGTTTFEVRASNAGGNASDNASVIFKQAPPRGPRVTITTPASSPSNSASATANVVATVQYVQSASEITVKRSNNTTVNFNYSGTTLTFTDNLNNGANTYTITAANANGSDSKSTTINYTAPAPGNGDVGRPRSVPASDPVIQLVTPGTLTATTSDQSYDVTMRTLGITSSSQITVKINGVTASSFNYAASTNTLTFTANLNNGVNTINVRIQNSVGYAEKELTITFTAQSRNSGGSGDSGSSSGDSKNTSKPRTTTVKPKTTTTEKPKTTTTTTPSTTTPRGEESNPPKAGETPAPKQEAPAPKAGTPRL
jgi:large repetitive protein